MSAKTKPSRRRTRHALLLAVALAGLTAPLARAQTLDYWMYVAAESADVIHLVRFGHGGLTVEKTIPVGESHETEGPHALRMSPSGKHVYLSTGHGIPDGKLWKYETTSDTLAGGPILLGFFPATIDLTPDGLYAFVANFNLHGEVVPSTISVVYTPTMTEVGQIETCITPHGSRIRARGDYGYSVCVKDDELVEIDTRTFEVSRRFSVAKDQERPIEHLARPPTGETGITPRGAAPVPTCSPTWALPAPSGAYIYVACNGGDEILEVSFQDWKLRRRFRTGRGPYNLAMTPDGRILVATLKQGAAVEFFDLASGASRAVTKSSATVTHGVEVSPDSRYAFVTAEGVGAEPGKVDVFDLQTFELIDSVNVGQQASGIAFWKTEPSS